MRDSSIKLAGWMAGGAGERMECVMVVVFNSTGAWSFYKTVREFCACLPARRGKNEVVSKGEKRRAASTKREKIL